MNKRMISLLIFLGAIYLTIYSDYGSYCTTGSSCTTETSCSSVQTNNVTSKICVPKKTGIEIINKPAIVLVILNNNDFIEDALINEIKLTIDKLIVKYSNKR